MPGKKQSVDIIGDVPTALGLQLKLLQPASYLTQVIQHGQSTFRKHDVELVFTADHNDRFIVWDLVIHFI